MTNKNIYIVGFMASGKTFAGRVLARKLTREFVDMDMLIEEKTNKKITDIFKEDGENHFRNIERWILEEISVRENLVVSCGGGVICDAANLKMLKKGVIFNLESSPERIYQRIKGDTTRPILNVADPMAKIKDLLAQRAPFYARADYSIRSEEETPQEVAAAIMKILENVK